MFSRRRATIKPLLLALFIWIVGGWSFAAETVDPEGRNYDPEKGVVILQVNWGRAWNCGGFENVQLQKLKFTGAGGLGEVILLAPSNLLTARDSFVPYVLLVTPGKYELAEFDVKAARSVSDLGHFQKVEGGTMSEAGGNFSVGAGEIVYIGHFGLDCGAEPFLWRSYIDGRRELEDYVKEFRVEYPGLSGRPVHFRLFSSTDQLLGNDYSLQNPVVE